MMLLFLSLSALLSVIIQESDHTSYNVWSYSSNLIILQPYGTTTSPTLPETRALTSHIWSNWNKMKHCSVHLLNIKFLPLLDQITRATGSLGSSNHSPLSPSLSHCISKARLCVRFELRVAFNTTKKATQKILENRTLSKLVKRAWPLLWGLSKTFENKLHHLREAKLWHWILELTK